jgi:hypothetical protein
LGKKEHLPVMEPRRYIDVYHNPSPSKQADTWRDRFDNHVDTEVGAAPFHFAQTLLSLFVASRPWHSHAPPYSKLGTRVSLLASFYNGKRDDDGARLVSD